MQRGKLSADRAVNEFPRVDPRPVALDRFAKLLFDRRNDAATVRSGTQQGDLRIADPAAMQIRDDPDARSV